MTDFRNYTLLHNISNLSGVRLSGPLVNLTFAEHLNLSDKNLTALFTSGSTFRSVWFNNSVAAHARFSVAMAQNFTVIRNGVAINSSWFDQTSGRINGTANVTGKYEFFNNACNADGCILGEFWVEDRSGWVDYNRHVFFATETGIFHTHKVDHIQYAHIDDEFVDLDYSTPLKNLYYHRSDLYNDGQDKVITN